MKVMKKVSGDVNMRNGLGVSNCVRWTSVEFFETCIRSVLSCDSI